MTDSTTSTPWGKRRGAGTRVIDRGRETLRGTSHRDPDRMEAGSFTIAAATGAMSASPTASPP